MGQCKAAHHSLCNRASGRINRWLLMPLKNACIICHASSHSASFSLPSEHCTAQLCRPSITATLSHFCPNTPLSQQGCTQQVSLPIHATKSQAALSMPGHANPPPTDALPHCLSPNTHIWDQCQCCRCRAGQMATGVSPCCIASSAAPAARYRGHSWRVCPLWQSGSIP